MRKIFTFFLLFSAVTAFSQQNITIPAKADSVLKGLYNPQDYLPPVVISARNIVIDNIVSQVSADTLKKNLQMLESFHNRNSGSDTVSATRGIGAARRWIHSRMQAYSAANSNRLLTGYLDFDDIICGMTRHRNVFGILPGSDTSLKEIVIIEAHMDSRCENNCDTSCYAPGMDDNGSGTVLVMELARVMSKYVFDRTIVFTTVTAEEQSLKGGTAWAEYFVREQIPVLACLNNDIVGGVSCGHTSSPPGCSPEGAIDSTTLRIFSFSATLDTSRYSEHKQLARYIKLQQIEEINPRITVPMDIDMEIREDREGRGGDHIPFRFRGFTSVRLTSRNEHGDGSGTAPDRQHTTTDILGVDTNVPPDGIIDSFFVDFNYLKRNAITNGVNLGLLASSPATPDWMLAIPLSGGAYGGVININDPEHSKFRIGIRSLGSGTLYFDEVLEVDDSYVVLDNLDSNKTYFISVASVEDGIESLFSEEEAIVTTGISLHPAKKGVTMNSYPNPSNGTTKIVVTTPNHEYGKARLLFFDILGKEVMEKEIKLSGTRHEQEVDLSELKAGKYYYSFSLRGEKLISNSLLLTNP